MKHDKLVRDKIPDIIRQRGTEPVTSIADDDTYWSKLREKLQEEVDEFLESENPEELADIMEVMHAICAHKDISVSDVEEMRVGKKEKRGGFSEKIILDEVRETPEQ